MWTMIAQTMVNVTIVQNLCILCVTKNADIKKHPHGKTIAAIQMLFMMLLEFPLLGG